MSPTTPAFGASTPGPVTATENPKERSATGLPKKNVRKEICLITKDAPEVPEQWAGMVDGSLEALKTDYIDLHLVAGLGGRGWRREEGGKMSTFR